MRRDPEQFAVSGGWRRIVALLAVAAWIFAVAVCPEAPEALAAATQPAIHGDHAANGPGHSDRHASCHSLSHASAVLHFAKAIRADIGLVAPPSPGAAVVHPLLAAPGEPAVAIVRAIDDRARPRSARFAGFWPHAPPLTL